MDLDGFELEQWFALRFPAQGYLPVFKSFGQKRLLMQFDPHTNPHRLWMDEICVWMDDINQSSMSFNPNRVQDFVQPLHVQFEPCSNPGTFGEKQNRFSGSIFTFSQGIGIPKDFLWEERV